MTTQNYGVFVVRIWLEPLEGSGGVWRASATDTLSKEKRYFAEPAELSAFLLSMNCSAEAVTTLEAERHRPE